MSAACRPNQTVERQTDDAGIKTSVKAKLAADVRFSSGFPGHAPESRRPCAIGRGAGPPLTLPSPAGRGELALSLLTVDC
ncbi:MAG TPA: hypothetical protein VKH43_04895 [Thermoanaerobaculia bacterium]|nr:hypothetical protein [Thermoanaerobaculia bacterium]